MHPTCKFIMCGVSTILVGCIILVGFFTRPIATVALESEVKQLFGTNNVHIDTITGDFPWGAFAFPHIDVEQTQIESVTTQYLGTWNPFTFLAQVGPFLSIGMHNVSTSLFGLPMFFEDVAALVAKPSADTWAASINTTLFNHTAHLTVDYPVQAATLRYDPWTLQYAAGAYTLLYKGRAYVHGTVEEYHGTWDLVMNVTNIITIETTMTIHGNTTQLSDTSVTYNDNARNVRKIRKMTLTHTPDGVIFKGPHLQVLWKEDIIDVTWKKTHFVVHWHANELIFTPPLRLSKYAQMSPLRAIRYEDNIVIDMGDYPVIIEVSPLRIISGPIGIFMEDNHVHMLVEGGYMKDATCVYMNASIAHATMDLMHIHTAKAKYQGDWMQGHGTFNLTNRDLKMNLDVDIQT